MEFWKIKNLSEGEVEINLYGEIVDSEPWWSFDELFITPTSFLREMEQLKNASSITIRLHSGGGDVFVALAIYNQLKSLTAKKTVIIDGLCASAATIIACAGDVVKTPKSAFYMIHDPTVVAYDNFGIDNLDKIKNMLEKCKLSIIEVYKTKVNLTDEELSNLMSAETWMLGEETVEKGFADVIIDQKVNVQNNGKFYISNNLYKKYKNLPKNIEATQNLTSSDVEDKTITKSKPEESEVTMNLEKLKNEFPELFNEVKNMGVAEERERLQDIEKLRNKVDKTLLQKAMFEEPIDAKTLAFENALLDDKNGKKYLNDVDEDLANSGMDDVGTAGGSPSNDEQANDKSDRIARATARINASRGGKK